MTSRGAAIAEVLRAAFDQLRELEKVAPGDVDQVVAMIVGHLRAWKPESASPLGVLPAPTTTIADPRGGR